MICSENILCLVRDETKRVCKNPDKTVGIFIIEGIIYKALYLLEKTHEGGLIVSI